jgi:hypothetical protein
MLTQKLTVLTKARFGKNFNFSRMVTQVDLYLNLTKHQEVKT